MASNLNCGGKSSGQWSQFRIYVCICNLIVVLSCLQHRPDLSTAGWQNDNIKHVYICYFQLKSLRILDSTRCQRTPLCHILLLNLDILQGSFRLCNWLSLRRLVSWINHLPPACWSTFRNSNSKQQLGCRFDIMDYESYFFVFWHMQLYMSWYIISFFGFTLLNILHFFKYSCTNIFL